jgi:hypothetical protein
MYFLAVKRGLDGPQLPMGWTVNEIPSTPDPHVRWQGHPPASRAQAIEATKGKNCRRLRLCRHQAPLPLAAPLPAAAPLRSALSAPAGGRSPTHHGVPSQGACDPNRALSSGTRLYPRRTSGRCGCTTRAGARRCWRQHAPHWCQVGRRARRTVARPFRCKRQHAPRWCRCFFH